MHIGVLLTITEVLFSLVVSEAVDFEGLGSGQNHATVRTLELVAPVVGGWEGIIFCIIYWKYL